MAVLLRRWPALHHPARQ